MLDGYFRVALPDEPNLVNHPITYIGPPVDDWNESYLECCSRVLTWLAMWSEKQPKAQIIFESEPRSR